MSWERKKIRTMALGLFMLSSQASFFESEKD
jgi:hypothetical protein